jgi:AFG3 family protein
MEENNNAPKRQFSFYWIYGIIAVALLGYNLFSFSSKTYPIAEDRLKTVIESGDVKQIIVINKEFAEVFINADSLAKDTYKEISQTTPFGMPNTGPHYTYNIGTPEIFDRKIQAYALANNSEVPIRWETRQNILGSIIGYILPIIILIAIWVFIMRRMGGGGGAGGSQIFNIGKSKATLFDRDTRVNVTFKDVAGLDEAKEEVVEVVDFLRHPKKYTALGGKIPKGVLLVGSPGTGKTLLAKAVAGEAGVPFFSISGSDFVEMFVGVGASRVRDLFKQARDKAPCIIFIDEIDAIGRARGRNSMQGNDERENTLNQLLVEMDGFATDKGVIIMAATNRPDILDSALMRPGRFDRQITIDKPDLVGREQIFKVHLKSIKLADDIDAKKLAALTPGFAGADIANICNEAALIAARRDKKAVEMVDFNSAVDRVIGGLEKKNKIISPQEKRIVVYHEAGHTLCSWFLEHSSPFVKVTVVPRGVAGGFAQYGDKEQFLYQREHLNDIMCGLLGGRAAEELAFGKISTGAQNDMERVTQIAYSMITLYGFSEAIGHVSFNDPQGNYQFTRPYSDETAHLIDTEARAIIAQQYNRAKQLLKEHYKELQLVAEALAVREVLDKEDVENLIGKRPYDDVPDQKDGEKAKSENHGSTTLYDTDIDADSDTLPIKPV